MSIVATFITALTLHAPAEWVGHTFIAASYATPESTTPSVILAFSPTRGWIGPGDCTDCFVPPNTPVDLLQADMDFIGVLADLNVVVSQDGVEKVRFQRFPWTGQPVVFTNP